MNLIIKKCYKGLSRGAELMSGELSILVNQLLMFMTAIGLGFFGYRLRVITDIIADSLSSFVVKFMIPIMLVYIIVEDGTPEGILSALPVMGASFLLVMILLGLGIISASFMDLDIKERAAHICMIGFSNSAFFGFPIFRAMYPAKSANFIATFMLVDALTLWTIAPSILSGEKRINWKKNGEWGNDCGFYWNRNGFFANKTSRYNSMGCISWYWSSM